MTCGQSCTAAKVHSGKKLLLDEFDKSILKFCCNQICPCNFQHYQDRRSGLDRRYLPMNKTPSITDINLRMGYGRRIDDVHNKARDPSGEIDFTKVVYRFFYPKA